MPKLTDITSGEADPVLVNVEKPILFTQWAAEQSATQGSPEYDPSLAEQPIEPGRYDAEGTKTGKLNGKTTKSHTVTVRAPGAVRINARQVNWPTAPVELDVARIAEDEWQFRTKGQPTKPNGDRGRVTAAFVTFDVISADGSIQPYPTDNITSDDTGILALDRPGLRIGDPRPRIVGSSTVIDLSGAAALPGGGGNAGTPGGVDPLDMGLGTTTPPWMLDGGLAPDGFVDDSGVPLDDGGVPLDDGALGEDGSWFTPLRMAVGLGLVGLTGAVGYAISQSRARRRR